MQLFRTINRLLKILGEQARVRFFGASVLIVLGGVVDLMGLTLVLPVLAVASDTELIHSNEFLNKLLLASGLSDTRFVQVLFASLVLVFVIRGLIYMLIKYQLSRFSYSVSAQKSVGLLVNHFNRELGQILNKSTSDIVRDIVINTQHFSSFVILPILILISESVIVFMLLLGLLVYDPLLVLLVFLVVFPTSAIFYFLTKRKVQQIGDERNQVHSRVTDLVLRGVAGIIEMKLFREENVLLRNLEQEQSNLVGLNVQKSVVVELFPKLVEISAVLGIVAVFFYATFVLDSPSTLLILLGVFGAASYRIIPSINKIVANLLFLKEYGYLFDIISEASEERRINYELELKEKLEFRNEISFREVEFSFSRESDFKLEIPKASIEKGTILGIVGKSGSGKSTLINLILGFYFPSKGIISVDGKELNKVNRRSWWDKIGFVKQDIFIQDESLKNNICFGVPEEDIDLDKLLRCCEQAQLKGLIESFKNGIEEKLGENGNRLSGGQKQRVAIARSLYSDSEVLVFDEATSGLDSETESEIFKTLLSLNKEGMTIILITHNLINLKYCSDVWEVERGQIKMDQFA